MRARVLIPTLIAAALAIALPAAPSFAADAATTPATTAPATTAPATDTGTLSGKLLVEKPETATIKIIHEKTRTASAKPAGNHQRPPQTDGKPVDVKPKADGTYEAKDLAPGEYFILVIQNGRPIARYQDQKVEAGQTTTFDIKSNMTTVKPQRRN